MYILTRGRYLIYQHNFSLTAILSKKKDDLSPICDLITRNVKKQAYCMCNQPTVFTKINDIIHRHWTYWSCTYGIIKLCEDIPNMFSLRYIFSLEVQNWRRYLFKIVKKQQSTMWWWYDLNTIQKFIKMI